MNSFKDWFLNLIAWPVILVCAACYWTWHLALWFVCFPFGIAVGVFEAMNEKPPRPPR